MIRNLILLVLFFFINLSILAQDQLSLLTWNVHMLPSIAQRSGQKKRAKIIVEQLQYSNYDVIVFTEAFNNRARRIIAKGLKKTFPYKLGPANKHTPFKINSGLFVMGKQALKHIDEIAYEYGKKSDRWASKGALMLSVNKDSVEYQIIATHLQADYTPFAEYKNIRATQLNAINYGLLSVYGKDKVPQIITGDLNIDKFLNKTEYKIMLDILDAQDGDLPPGEYTFIASDYVSKKDSSRCILDYTLYRPNATAPVSIERKVRKFKQAWKPNKFDLSDHYALETIIKQK